MLATGHPPDLQAKDVATRVVALVARASPDSAAGRAPVRVDWRVESTTFDARQLAYELESCSDAAFGGGARAAAVASSGAVASARQLDVEAPGGVLRSREVRHLRVRVATAAGWSAWSAATTVEAGLLAPSDWTAVAVAPPGASAAAAAPPLLRRAFSLPAAPRRARLHATAHGCFELRVNGRAVGDALLSPGWTPYRRRLLVETHDVTALLTSGANVVAATLADGWFRGRLGWDADRGRCRYGERLALLLQLEVELADGGVVVVATGPEWRAATGELLAADIYDGCFVDLRRRRGGWNAPGYDDAGWAPVDVVALDLAALQPRVAPPVRRVAVLEPTLSPCASPLPPVRVDVAAVASQGVRAGCEAAGAHSPVCPGAASEAGQDAVERLIAPGPQDSPSDVERSEGVSGATAAAVARRCVRSTLLDSKQNAAGFVRLTVRGRAGACVVVRHAEVLDKDGGLHMRALRTAKATDAYVLDDDDGDVVLEPRFTFHGFRYAQIDADVELVKAEVVVISSDLPRRGHFECSDAALTRFQENVVWSQRANFVSLPTDCPQRDERLGWTGDAAAFAATSCILFDARAFWASWLVDLALEQEEHGGVPSFVPFIDCIPERLAFGRAGWADAATVVPEAVDEAYDDAELLRRQLGSMEAHLAYLRPRLDALEADANAAGGDGADSDAAREGDAGAEGAGAALAEAPAEGASSSAGVVQFGDWLDPDAPGERPWQAKTSSEFLADAFLVHSAALTARAARRAGAAAAAAAADAAACRAAALTWARWGEHAVSTQTGCAVALQFGVAPEAERPRVAAALARLVRAADGAIATGFVGTPHVLPALAAAGHLSEAYLMLLRRDMPSWLYQVERGATSVWERWDAIRPDGSVHDESDSMLSFNHYAYGAVVDWVYRTVAGLAPDPERPGYVHVLLRPRPVKGVDRVAASIECALGTVRVEWRLDEGGAFVARYVIPFGASASFSAPAAAGATVLVNGVRQQCVDAAVPGGLSDVKLWPGTHDIVVDPCVVVDRMKSSLLDD